MAINTQTIRIDLNTGRTIPVAFAHQNDTNRQLTFQLYNNGVAFTPSSTTVKFAYKSPIVNGRYSVITGSQMASGTVSGNTVTVTLPAQYTQVSGVGLLTMILTTSGNTLRPVNIKFVCQGSADGDDTILAASDWPEGLYDYMDNWLEENEPTEIANLKSDLSALADIVPSPNLLDVDAVTNGYLRNTGAITVSGDWVTTDFIPVESGKTYTYSVTVNEARQTGTMYFRLEYDSDKNIISGSYAETAAQRITVGENTKYVRFSYHNLSTVTERCFVEGNEIVYYEFGIPSSVTVKDESNSEYVKRLVEAVEVTQSENLFNKDTAKSGYIRNMNGDITASTDWFYSDYIAVEYGKTYVLFGSTTKQALYFLQEVNASKSGINYVNNASTQYTPSSADVKYIRFCQKPNVLNSLVFKEGNQATMIYTAYGDVLVPPYRGLLYGKSWVAVGDSLTEKNVSAVSNYTDFISTINRMNLTNMGVGGTGYMRGYDANNAFYQRVANIPDCDIITLFGSGNDLAYYSQLGTTDDTTTDTICGCINKTLDVIFENHPTTPLLVIAPTPWAGNTPDMSTGMALYCERLKEICSKRGVAYLDLFHHSGLRPNDETQRDLVFYDGSLDGHGDYVHPNKLGHSIISPRIMQAMESVALT